MSMWSRKCPCCNEKILKVSMLTRNMHYACKQKENYKCLHCPSCHKQISKPYHLFSETVYGGLLLLIFFGLAKYVVSVFTIPPKLPEGLLIIPQVFVYLMIFAYLYPSLVPLKCYETDNDMKKNQREDSDNVLIKGMFELDEHIKIDPLEKKMLSHLMLSPTYYFLFIVLGVILVWIYKYFSL